MGVLSEFSSSSDSDVVVDGNICENPQKATEATKLDTDDNPTKSCSGYGVDDCKGKTAEYVITEAAGCTKIPDSQLTDYYYYCVTTKKAVPNGKCVLNNS